MANKLSKNVFMVFIARGVDLLFSLVIIAVVTRYLGVEVYGKYALLMAVVLMLTSIANLGMPRIMVREIAQNHERAAEFLGAALLFSVLMLGVVVVVSPVALKVLGIEGMLALAFPVAIAAEMIQIFSGLYVAVFLAYERMELDAMVTVASRFLFFLLLGIVVLLDLPLLYIFIFLLVANTSGLLLATQLARRRFSIKPDFAQWRETLGYLVKEVLPVGGAFVVFLLYQYVDVFVLKLIKGFEDVALFQAPYTLISKIQYGARILVIALAPVFARLALLGNDLSTLRFVYSHIAKYIIIASLPLLVIGVFYSVPIVKLFFGEEFILSANVIMIFIFAIPMIIVDLFSDLFLVSIGRQSLGLISISIGLIINLILDIVLVTLYGYVGAAIASLVALSCVFMLNMYFIQRNAGALHLSGVFVLPLLFAAAVFALMAFIWTKSPSLAAGITTFAYVAGLFAFSYLWRTEMQLLLDKLKG